MENITAVEWLFNNVQPFLKDNEDLFESACMAYAVAKQMEREQIITANADGQYLQSNFLSKDQCFINAEHYYTETYRGNK